MSYSSRYTPYNSHTGFGSFIGVVLVFLALIAWVTISFVTAHSNNSVQVLHITSVDDQSTSKGHQYLIFAHEGVFKDTDNIWLGKWNSSNLYNQLQSGTPGTFRCHVHGLRQEITSNYPDLISCTRIGPLKPS